MTDAIRSRGGFIATMILTVILAFPLARLSAVPAIGERFIRAQAIDVADPTPASVREATEVPPAPAVVNLAAAPDTMMRNMTVVRPEPVSVPAVARTRAEGAPSKVCRIAWRDGPRKVERLVRCAARHFRVSVETAVYVANRESNFLPHAYNASSCAKGIFQHLCRYWPDRSTDFGFRGWSAFNARANIMVTMKMVRRYGWEPWGG